MRLCGSGHDLCWAPRHAVASAATSSIQLCCTPPGCRLQQTDCAHWFVVGLWPDPASPEMRSAPTQ
jgi:hypothetical protein